MFSSFAMSQQAGPRGFSASAIEKCKFTLDGDGGMIESIRHKGLRRFYEENDRRLLAPEMIERIQGILSVSDEAKTIRDVDRPTLRLHALKGDRRGFWSVTVHANWRIIFRFVNGNVLDVDFVDYH
jgi:toxin HigB-1